MGTAGLTSEMNVSEQGVNEPRPEGSRRRYRAIPRTLIFVTSFNPDGGQREVLLLKGAPTKRLWPNRYNGLGGHVEADEDILSAARRELAEEAGLAPETFTLRGVIHIHTGEDDEGPLPGVLVFVFHAESEQRAVTAAAEGTPEWIPVGALADYALVDDLPEILSRVLAEGPVFFGHYTPRPDGSLEYRFTI